MNKVNLNSWHLNDEFLELQFYLQNEETGFDQIFNKIISMKYKSQLGR